MIIVKTRSYLLVVAILLLVSAASMSQKVKEAAGAASSDVRLAHYLDPDIVDSEWNHHLAGYALILSAALYLIGQRLPRLSWSKSAWIMALIAAAVFLALWSDKEMWPRGTLSWLWLIHHDAEARQHKVYSLLLFAIALIEYLRQSGKLSRRWGTWAFPSLALVGACLLLMHTHDGHSGLPAGWDDAQKRSQVMEMAQLGTTNKGGAVLTLQRMEPMPMAPFQRGTAESMAHHDSAFSPHGHHGGGSAQATHVEQQHLWFAVVGFALALFKWADDAQFWRGKFVSYLWPCSMFTLGVLLVLYTEMP